MTNFSFIQKTISFFAFLAILCSISSTAYAETKNPSLNEIKKLLPDTTLIENKIVYVDFWASWCAPCRLSFPWMKELLTKFVDSEFVIITVNVDREKEKALKFLKEFELNAVNKFDETGKIAKQFNLTAMPTSFVFGKDGEFKFKHEGFLKKESADIENKISRLIKGMDVVDE